jgi:HSP20 family protein
MRVRELMTQNPVCCLLSDVAQTVAQILRDEDIGSMPVVSDGEQKRLEGIITDRDLCCPRIRPEVHPNRSLYDAQPGDVPSRAELGLLRQADAGTSDSPHSGGRSGRAMHRYSCPSRSDTFEGIRQSAEDSSRNFQTVANDHNGTGRSLIGVVVLTAQDYGQPSQNLSPAWPANWLEGEQDVARPFGSIRRTRFLNDQMNRVFRNARSSRERSPEEYLVSSGFAPPVDVYEDEHNITLKIEVPGIDEKDIDVRMENSVLTVHGERKFEKEEKEENFHRVERQYGSFTRSFTLPSTVDPDQVRATRSH